MYDYCVVGAGLFGATFAWHARQAGKSVLVVDSRDHIGGNCYTYDEGGIQVHKYGPHIFHTSSRRIWDFVNKFATFNSYVHRVKAINAGRIYSMPINMMTLHQVYGVRTPDEASERLDKAKIPCSNPQNLEKWILSQVGVDLYEKLIKHYTEKQWGRSAQNLPSAIVKRLPIRLTYDDNYFNDTYQGIPIGGYTRIFEQLLEGCDVRLGVDFFKEREALEAVSLRTVYTGKIDEFFDNVHGQLEYRTLEFDTKVFQVENYQGLAQLNWTSNNVGWTRTIEHKHFDPVSVPHTVVTWESPVAWYDGATPYYPVNDDANNEVYRKYRSMADKEPRTIFGGRLAKYLYMDMHQVVGAAIHAAEKEGLVVPEHR